MQVDPAPRAAVDGVKVNSEVQDLHKESESMVGNPQQVLPPELRGDVPLGPQNQSTAVRDCRAPEASSKVATRKTCDGKVKLSPVCAHVELHDKTEALKDGTSVFPVQPRLYSRKISPDGHLNVSQSRATPKKPATSLVPPVINLPPGFHCSSLIKPTQHMAFMPSTNFSSPLCKITLPPGLGQIAALREATANQFRLENSSQNPGTATQLHTYPCHYSLGCSLVPETKSAAAKPKPKGSASCNKGCKSLSEHSSPVGFPPFPLKHMSFGSSPASLPTSAPTLTSITVPSRPSHHSELGTSQQGADKMSLTYARLESQSPVDKSRCDDICPHEMRDVPLDLSSKSRRQNQNSYKQPQRTLQTTDHQVIEVSQHLANSNLAKQPQAGKFGTAATTLPDNLKNGAPPKQTHRLQNHQLPEPPSPWAKISHQGSLPNLPGTYVGIASPILASTLRSKDGTCAPFVEDLQCPAKQESISIIDQGEQIASRARKAVSGSKVSQQTPNSKRSKSSCLPTAPSKDIISSALPIAANSRPSAGKVAIDRHPQALLPRQRTPKQVLPNPPNNPSHNLQSNLTQTGEQKWDKNKSPLSNLESIVKQTALETATLSHSTSSQGVLGPSMPDVFAHPHTGQREPQSGAIGIPPFSTIKWKELKPKKDSSCRAELTAAYKREKGNSHKVEENLVQVKREYSPERVDWPPEVPTLLSQGVSEEREVENEMKVETLPPSINLEGIALSILKGSSAELEKASEIKTGGKPKKYERHRSDKDLPTSPKMMDTNLKKKAVKEGTTEKQGQRVKKKKPWAPEVEQQQQQRADAVQEPESERTQGDRKAPQAEPFFKIKEGSEIISPPHFLAAEIPASRHRSRSSRSKSGEHELPRLRRGNRLLRSDWNLPAFPSPPQALPAIRRPRGRPRSHPPPGRLNLPSARLDLGGSGDTPPRRKRSCRRNSKYQNGEYITEKEQDGDGEEKCLTRQAARATTEARTGVYPRLSATLPGLSSRKALLTRSGATRHVEDKTVATLGPDKPSGKRKFKSKHLCNTEEAEEKLKSRRTSGKRSAVGTETERDSPPPKKSLSPFTAPKGLPTGPPANRKGGSRRGSTPDSPTGRPVPPEVRRLIVNKNAGETLLQRAARLGYEEVVLYCLEKDEREVNRRDNAGYTALHEACAHGWPHIVQVLLEHGADVNCSAQDGTRPIHDAVVSDNLPVVWMLLSHGADPTLATYSGQTPAKLAQSHSMKSFLKQYFADLETQTHEDPNLPWDFYSSCLFEAGHEACWDFLLSYQDEEKKEQECGSSAENDSFLFEFSSEPLLPCYHMQVSLSQGKGFWISSLDIINYLHQFCNWFLLSDVLKRLKMSARIFRARYPHFEVVSMSRAELCNQLSISQITPLPGDLLHTEGQEGDNSTVELVRCIPDLQGLLGSSVHLLEEERLEVDVPCQR